MGTQYGPGTMLHFSHISPHVIPMATLGVSYNYPNFMDVEIEVERLNDISS